ncbi:serine/arginine repetitive matrix protein 1-like [Sitophilus oryzae]|uniref:Serine/arginine repetitive matrix protein 1-like n=1 Tax=Sitophilus oryzae TaxID=7048 RepID=A0A6J2YKP1_SITOR|nr:serine/arginine repetitive matrix protein 1-like [Sitophilus oryzae]
MTGSDDSKEKDESNTGNNLKVDPENSGVQENAKEDKHEDVPDDFFDDFEKEDFMAGLDIVDEDEEGEAQEERDKFTIEKQVEKEIPIKKTKKKIERVRKKIKKPAKSANQEGIVLTADEELKQLDAEIDKAKTTNKPKKQKITIDADTFDIRRDPEKTRQAIQKDKIKTAKDKEKRRITDIVQTGLVPPGMELEVDLEDVQQNYRPIRDLREKLKPKKSRTRSPQKTHDSPPKKRRSRSKNKVSPKRKSQSKNKLSPKRKSQSKNRISPKRKSRSKNRSPRKQSPSPPRKRSSKSPLRRRRADTRNLVYRRSPYRSKSPRRSPIRRSPKYNLRRSPPMYPRKSRSRSPILVRRRSRDRGTSPLYRRSRNRSSSPRPRRYRSRSRSPRKPLRNKEKMSFLEELAVKLNETRAPSAPVIPPAPVMYSVTVPPQPVVVPAPVPAPVPQVPYFPPVVPRAPAQPPPQQQQPYDPYDQSFFIGTPPSKQPGPSQQHSNGVPAKNKMPSIAKLFEDQKIRLSDYLAITAKPQVSSSTSEKLQEKIRAIQRCQEAVKILSEKRFSGPLLITKTDTYKPPIDDQRVSPLLRRPVVLFPFTTAGPKRKPEFEVKHRCKSLLERLGAKNTTSNLIVVQSDRKAPAAPKITEVPKKEFVQFKHKLESYNKPAPPKIPVITKSFSTQTDRELSICRECFHRKGILYANCGVQTGNPVITFSVGTQVYESDFYSMIPKTQSLASLTPAQLLGKQLMTGDNARNKNLDVFGLHQGNRPSLHESRSFLPFTNPTAPAQSFQNNSGDSRYPPPPPPPLLSSFFMSNMNQNTQTPFNSDHNRRGNSYNSNQRF